VDRCALFVDAGYVLADGAMAVHGTSHRESVSWDYAGLLQFFAGLSADRTGLQLLRCYWYEATLDGRRTPEHDTLADMPGLTLRLGRMRPGKREGVETEIHRDLTTLARNRAISDVLLVSAEEDLAQVIADVQDLGVRVIIVHISVDGNWTVSRSLRQQCDDIVEIDGAHLRPYVELIAGAEPAGYNEYAAGYGGKPLSNGYASTAGAGHQTLSAGATGSHPAPPAIYTAPVVAEYQAPAQPAPAQPAPAQPAPPARPQAPAPPQPPARQPATPPQPEPAPAMETGPAEPDARGMYRSRSSASPSAPQSSQDHQIQSPEPRAGQRAGQSEPEQQHGPPMYAPASASFREPPGPGAPTGPGSTPGPGSTAGPGSPAGPASPAGQDLAAAQQGHSGSASSPAAAGQESAVSPPPPSGHRASGPRPPYAPPHPGSFAEAAASQFSPAPPEHFSAPPGLPSRRGQQDNGLPGSGAHRNGPQPNGPHSNGPHSNGPHSNGPHSNGPQPNGPQPNGLPPQRSSQSARAPQAPRGQQAQRQLAAPGGAYVPQQGPYSAQLPGPLGGAGSFADSVQAAHAEGFEFGESVAREAPALWLEAVIARKPRMPSDLEARLLQGSALPIDSLLHDEVRQALRRGFWDALERSRR
jgi:uncharacterized LabA/DUF88 family protein